MGEMRGLMPDDQQDLLFDINNIYIIVKRSFFFFQSSFSHNFNSRVSHFSFNYKDDNLVFSSGPFSQVIFVICTNSHASHNLCYPT